MIRCLTIGFICFTVATYTAADDQLIDARGLPYEGSISDYHARTISMRATNTGRTITRTVDQIRALTLEGFNAFNQAEDLVAKKKYKQALPVYDKALQTDRAKREWIKALVTDRRYQACAKAGLIDRALKDWLAMMDADPNDKISQALMPETFALQGDPANAAALKLLNAKLTELKDAPKDVGDYARRLLKLKMKLLEAMGEEEKATAAAEAITRLNAPPAAKIASDIAGNEEDESQPTRATSDLDVLKRLVEAGKYDDVIKKLAPRIKSLPRNDLAGPLFLLAKAQWLKYQADEPKDRKLLLRAGLNLMWVYSAYGNSDEAPEALFLTAQLHKALNDTDAARNALEELVEQFGGADDNPWVTRAQELLENEKETE
jgi:TolA-binding protein